MPFKTTKLFFAVSIALILTNCTSVENYNKRLREPISVKKLQKDIDYTQQKLEKLHPSLYWYISKEQLDSKFDSLRNSVKKPMTSNEFFLTISPIVASVRQGHMGIYPLNERVSKKEAKRLKKAGPGPISQIEMSWIDNKMYVFKNKSKEKNIKVGMEIVEINQITPQDIYKKYSKTYTSDGFNKTFLPKIFSKRFVVNMTNEIGLKDSVTYVFRHKDSSFSQIVRRNKIKVRTKVKNVIKKDTISKPVIAKIDLDKLKAKQKAEKKHKKWYGYNKETKEYSKVFTINSKDSTTAVLRIKDFSKGQYDLAYEEIFDSLKKTNVKNLIIDLRDNGGGRVSEIVNLYSYLTNKDYVMLQKSIVTSKTSLWRSGFYAKIPKVWYPVVSLGYPFYMATSYIKAKKDSLGVYRTNLTGSKLKKFNKNHFTGKVYVIINGGCFSATVMISAALKSDSNVTFVGEETGGTFNGNVAGLMPVLRLPNSKLPFRIGLMDLRPTNEKGTFGRGVFPDVEIIPTLKDKIENKDPEMEWILKQIKK